MKLSHAMVVRCFCLRGGRLLLLRHRSMRSNQEFWGLPGGIVKSGETLSQAAKRELVEETGLSGVPAGILSLQEFPKVSMIEVVLLFRNLSGTARLGEDPDLPEGFPPRILELKWFRRSELPSLQPRDFYRKFRLSGLRKLDLIALPYEMALD